MNWKRVSDYYNSNSFCYECFKKGVYYKIKMLDHCCSVQVRKNGNVLFYGLKDENGISFTEESAKEFCKNFVKTNL